jgi:hypothetical protein
MFSLKLYQSFQFEINTTLFKKFNKGSIEIYIVGKPMGAIVRDRVVYKKDLINLIVDNYNNKKELYNLLRVSVGQFYVLIKTDQEVTIINSPASSGLFYIKKESALMMSDNEEQMYRYSSLDQINEYELLHMIVSKGAIKSPFETIFKDVHSVISGQAVKIDNNLNIDIDTYILQESCEIIKKRNKNKFLDIYDEFVFLMDSTVRIIEKETQGNKKIVLLSGGVDSCSLLAAHKKAGSDIIAATWDKAHGVLLPDLTKEICEIQNVNHIVLKNHLFPPKNKSSLKIADEFYKNVLLRSPTSLGAPLKDILNKYHNQKFHIIHGQNMDSGYVIEGFRPGFGQHHLLYLKDLLKSVCKRYMYTPSMMRRIAKNQKLIYMLPFFSKNKIYGYNPYDYLLSMIAPAYEHIVPLQIDSFFPESLKSLERSYVNYKEKTILKPLIKSKEKLNSRLKKENSQSYFNHLVRIIKYVRFSQGANRVVNKEFNHNRLEVSLPASEGPLLNFFLNYELNFGEVLYPKKMLFKYFKNEYGRSFFNLINYHNNLRLTVKLFFKNKINKLVSMFNNSSNNNLANSLAGYYSKDDMDILIDYYIEVLNPNKSILINNIKNDCIKKYLTNIYKNFSINKMDIKDVSFAEIERLVSLEVYIKNLFK